MCLAPSMLPWHKGCRLSHNAFISTVSTLLAMAVALSRDMKINSLFFFFFERHGLSCFSQGEWEIGSGAWRVLPSLAMPAGLDQTLARYLCTVCQWKYNSAASQGKMWHDMLHLSTIGPQRSVVAFRRKWVFLFCARLIFLKHLAL